MCNPRSVDPSGPPSRGPAPGENIYIQFPGEDQILVGEYQAGDTPASPYGYRRVYTFNGNNPNGTGVNKKRFVNEDTKTGTILGIKIVTAITPGAQPPPDEIPKTALCDEGTFNFEVKGNFSHDFITQIVQ